MQTDALTEAMLGYLNFSDGSPSTAFQKNVNELFRLYQDGGDPEPWRSLRADLRARAEHLDGSEGTYRDLRQARSVVELVFERVIPGYRRHHRDLLFGLSDEELFQPFFIARVFEATLSSRSASESPDEVAQAAIGRLNDFIGHRPLAVLENGRKMTPYAHERVRPIPLYIAGAGVGVGRFEAIIARMLDILARANPQLLTDAYFNLSFLDELAIDPRAYDHGHPVSQRPSYLFGEWDPHHLDIQGRYRRFVVRGIILDALYRWIETASAGLSSGDSGLETRTPEEALFEAAATLAGTMLLASGISGDRPEAHDSTVTLGILVPRVAKCRDAFYAELLGGMKGAHGDRLRAEAALTRQPFGGIRQFLNHRLAAQRAKQLQSDRLAQLYAQMGYPDASRKEARRIPAPAIRIRCEIRNLLTAGSRDAERAAELGPGNARDAIADGLAKLREIDDLLHRGIECGALVDPWNILGFQGNFSLFPSIESTAADPRVQHLIQLVQRTFELHAELLREAAAAGDDAGKAELEQSVRKFAAWWDKFATVEVADVPHVYGEGLAHSALFVAKVLAEWRRSGASAGDIAFWRLHAVEFSSPQAFGSVVEALLAKNDYVAAMALLMQWLGQSDQAPLEDERYSFHSLILQWMAGILEIAARPVEGEAPAVDPVSLVRKLFDYLEANAEDYWNVPLDEIATSAEVEEPADDSEAETFAAAYEGVSYRDSTDDGKEGSVFEGGDSPEDEEMFARAERVGKRLKFLSTMARLWQLAATIEVPGGVGGLAAWAKVAERNKRDLGKLIRTMHAEVIAPPGGTQDSIMEYDRRQAVKEEMITKSIGTAIETAHAFAALAGLGLADAAGAAEPLSSLTDWEPKAIELQRLLKTGTPEGAREQLRTFLRAVRNSPLLYVPLEKGGNPLAIYEAKYLRDIFRRLADNLPRLGLLRETFYLFRSALKMERSEQSKPHAVHYVTEFNFLFEVGYHSVIENVVESFAGDANTTDDELAEMVASLVRRFSKQWIGYTDSVRLFEIERRTSGPEWDAMVDFIQKYGRELFGQQFFAFGNLRGILHQGVGAYLDSLVENQDPYRPLKIVEDLGVKLDRKLAIEHIEYILRSIVENHDVYKDYNSTTTQSDYGENLYILMEILRLQVEYQRKQWALQPAYIAHNILGRQGRARSAAKLQQAFIEETADLADGYLKKLSELQRKYGVQLPIVADRLGERFVQPLQLDRILALIEPSVKAANHPEPRMPGEQAEPFVLLQREIENFVQDRRGSSQDVPSWIRQLEYEVGKAHGRWREDDILQNWLRVPRRPLLRDELNQQLKTWDESL